MHPIRIASLALLAAIAGTAVAQKAYRYVYPDGRVIYSDKPVPGAKLQGELAAPPPPTSPPAAPGEATAAQRPAGEDPAAARVRRLAEADEEVRAAESALNQARLRQAAGREPTEGERTGTATGGSRLNEAYDARQRENEKAVADAQARLDRAVAARNAAR
jgi:hypothetical protein